ncbi:hypothetical protein [Nonomuraea roseoviolacea]|uniref:SRPBCC family protein n=1 Tax=Nonomuraea roseoviolacea subsp. carminata TaxID=160689 RepID=A0ABT1JZP9_9ACTN|nr:hypothetical protein [Nonomuraea roseoviolacea]MCP2347238.1 hypothetical protein [Nonomuraea roseoviolacea subsp. carminata]
MSDKGRKLITEVSGVVEAPVERVREALRKTLLPELMPDGDRFTVEDFPGHRSTVEITDRMIALQGGWWYRGEWTLAPVAEGTRLTHRVYNVATSLRWGVPLANRFFLGYDRTTRDSFAAGLTRLGADLGCPVHLTP